jgi:toxin ParE1/3/4
MKSVVFNPVAVGDLDEIVSFIAADDPGAANRVRDAVLNTAGMLGLHPNLGCRPSFSASRFKGIRFLPTRRFQNYLIFYLEHENDVEVLRVLHAARDVGRLFK